MPLLHRRQPLARFIPFHDLTYQQVAVALSCDVIRVRNISNGHVYPHPDEIAALEKLFSLPIEVLLEPQMLIYRNGPWPPLRGAEAFQYEQALKAQGLLPDLDPSPEEQVTAWRRAYEMQHGARRAQADSDPPSRQHNSREAGAQP